MTYKPSKSHWPWLWPYKVTQGQISWCCWTLQLCYFLFVSNSNTWSNSAPLRDISLRNRNDLDSDLSSSRKSNAIAPMDLHTFLLMCRSSQRKTTNKFSRVLYFILSGFFQIYIATWNYIETLTWKCTAGEYMHSYLLGCPAAWLPDRKTKQTQTYLVYKVLLSLAGHSHIDKMSYV